MNGQDAQPQGAIRSLLRAWDSAPGDIDAAARALTDELTTLERMLVEQDAYAVALAAGDLSVTPPADNSLCAALIALHKRLLAEQRHGEAMFAPTQKRPAADAGAMAMESPSGQSTTAASHDGGDVARFIDENNELVVYLAGALDLGLIIVAVAAREILFENRRARALIYADQRECQKCPHHGALRRPLLEYHADNPARVWELSCKTIGTFCRVSTHQVLWHGRLAYAHLIEDMSKQQARMTPLTQRMYQDDLTGLPNRRLCDEQLDRYLAGRTPFTVCYFDIDSVSAVNEAHGRDEGNQYIQLVVDVVRRFIRDDDFFGRYGDDEFVVIFRNIRAATIETKFGQICEALHNNAYATKPYRPSIRFGVLEIAGSRRLTAAALVNAVRAKLPEVAVKK